MSVLDHEHLIVRAVLKNPITSTYENETKIIKLIHDVIESQNMSIAIGPKTWYCKDLGNEGWTGFAIITTSHIALHSWTEDKVLQFDLYSCSKMDPNAIFDVLINTFEIVSFNHIWLDRKQGITIKRK